MRPIPGDPQALRDAASALSTRAGDLSTHRGSARGARHAALAQWDGSASMSFGGTMATYAKDIDRQAAALLRLAASVHGMGNAPVALSALLWALAFAAWLACCGPMLLAPSLPRRPAAAPARRPASRSARG